MAKPTYLKEFVGKSLRAFISYAHQDRVAAGNLKIALENFDIETFLAHDDINPSEEWQQVILKSLSGCDIFLPLLTDNFADSNWTDQETGHALAHGKLIIPLKCPNDPYGFISRFQAMRHDPAKPSRTAGRILDLLADKPEFEGAVKDCLVRGLTQSWSFDRSNELAGLLDRWNRFDPEQANAIVAAASFNDQVYYAWKAAAFAGKVFRTHQQIIPKQLAGAYKNTRTWIDSKGERAVRPAEYRERLLEKQG